MEVKQIVNIIQKAERKFEEVSRGTTDRQKKDKSLLWFGHAVIMQTARIARGSRTTV
jgi:hypothetical protein